MATVFGPAVACIYCGGTEGGLSNEHIVPSGLRGDLIFRDASCDECRKITQRFEQGALRGLLDNLRLRYSIPTRKHTDRSQDFEIEIGGFQKHRISHGERPSSSWLLPHYSDPGILCGRPPWDEGGASLQGRVSTADVNAMLSYSGHRHPVKWLMSSVDWKSFERMLAKIAHSYAVALIGFNHFKPILNDFILKGSGVGAYWIGSKPGLTKPPQRPVIRQRPNGEMYEISLTRQYSHARTMYYMVTIRLLGWFCTPLYGVVVGRSIGQPPELETWTHRRQTDIMFDDI